MCLGILAKTLYRVVLAYMRYNTYRLKGKVGYAAKLLIITQCPYPATNSELTSTQCMTYTPNEELGMGILPQEGSRGDHGSHGNDTREFNRSGDGSNSGEKNYS